MQNYYYTQGGDDGIMAQEVRAIQGYCNHLVKAASWVDSVAALRALRQDVFAMLHYLCWWLRKLRRTTMVKTVQLDLMRGRISSEQAGSIIRDVMTRLLLLRLAFGAIADSGIEPAAEYKKEVEQLIADFERRIGKGDNAGVARLFEGAAR